VARDRGSRGSFRSPRPRRGREAGRRGGERRGLSRREPSDVAGRRRGAGSARPVEAVEPRDLPAAALPHVPGSPAGAVAERGQILVGRRRARAGRSKAAKPRRRAGSTMSCAASPRGSGDRGHHAPRDRVLTKLTTTPAASSRTRARPEPRRQGLAGSSKIEIEVKTFAEVAPTPGRGAGALERAVEPERPQRGQADPRRGADGSGSRAPRAARVTRARSTPAPSKWRRRRLGAIGEFALDAAAVMRRTESKLSGRIHDRRR
jgi:hypothetical protein